MLVFVTFCSVLICCYVFYVVLACLGSVLICFDLCRSIAFCSVLFCSVLFWSGLFCSVLLCSVLLCSVVVRSVLLLICFVGFDWLALFCFVLFWSMLFCVSCGAVCIDCFGALCCSCRLGFDLFCFLSVCSVMLCFLLWFCCFALFCLCFGLLLK